MRTRIRFKKEAIERIKNHILKNIDDVTDILIHNWIYNKLSREFEKGDNVHVKMGGKDALIFSMDDFEVDLG